MGNTVLGLFGVGLAAGLAELLLPGEEGKGTKKALALLTTLAVLLLLLRPFVTFLQSERAFSFEGLLGESEADVRAEYEEIFERAVAAGSERDLREGIYAWLSAEYGIEKEDAYIKISFDDRGALLRVEIYLSGSALLQDPAALGEILGNKLGCETEVR